MPSFNTNELSAGIIYHYMIAGIAPRPIALVSTISRDGVNNLAPFSFFNAFSCNPPVLGFCPACKDDGTYKDTYRNLAETGECVIQMVSYEMTSKIVKCAEDFPPESDEFHESGLTPIDSDTVKAKRVKESPFQMECRLMNILQFNRSASGAAQVDFLYPGDAKLYGRREGGAGNLIICEVLKFHIDVSVLRIDASNKIDYTKLDLSGRNGGNFYTRSWSQSLFETPR
jgi:flavin reductase (DIM6/NTAB) family NADH-FMN oxidoreductase RutF